MSVLDKIFGSIDNFFQKLFTKIKMIPKSVYEACNTLYPIFVKIKADLESNTANMITALIPGNLDDELKKDLILCIDAALKAMGYVEGEIEEKYKEFIEENKNHAPLVKNALLLKTLSVSAANLHGNKEKESVYDTAAQNTVYNHLA